MGIHRLPLSVSAIFLMLLPTSSAFAMSASFSWSGTTACSSTSPAFKVGDVPAGTKSLAFSMTDQDKPSYNHGGGKIAYAGSANIPKGAFSYTGPCPPAGQQHTYVWTIEALDASGKVLATAKARAKFPTN